VPYINTFTLGLNKLVRSLEGDEKMTMIREEYGDDSVSLSTNENKSQAKLTARLLLRTVTEISKAQNIHSWVLLDHPPPKRPGIDKRYGQIV
jgi:hypothetical protein